VVSRPFASVLIPTRAPGPPITDVLGAVFAQKPGFAYEVVVVDSGSGPDDLARLASFPLELHHIPPSAFGHGRTRNQLARLARGERLLYLSQDAEPAGPDWMVSLVRPLDDPWVAGAYARQLPRSQAHPFSRFFLDTTYGPRPRRRRLAGRQRVTIDEIFFSNVSSALRRDVWERIPFRDRVVMSEDQYWAFDVLRAGYEVVYEPAAAVYHSHDYSLRALYRRNLLSGASLRGLIHDSPVHVARRGLRYVTSEAACLVRDGRPDLIPYMLLYELVKSLGFALGAASAPGRRAIAVDQP
jgi:rhamnosyltransferase